MRGWGYAALIGGFSFASSLAFAQSGGPPGGEFFAIAIDPANPAVIYAGANGGGVFKSINGGATWGSITPPNLNRFVFGLAIDPAQPTTIYAATARGGGIFKSVDGGTAWSSMNTGLTSSVVSAVTVDPANTATIYAGTTQNGVFKSDNGAVSWTAMNSGLTSLAIQAVTIDPKNGTIYAATNGGGVFKSINRGVNWAATNAGLTDLVVDAIAVDTNNSSILYAGTANGGVFKSVNGGSNWTAANTGINSVLSIRSLAIDRNNTNVLYAAAFGGVYKSLNGAATWIAANSGISILEGSGVPGAFGVAIDPTNSSTVYLATQSQGGIFKTTSGGAGWNALNIGLAAVEASAIAIDPLNPATLYLASQTDAIYKSADHGVTWAEANLGFSTLVTASIAIDPHTTTTIYVGTGNRGNGEGIFKTTNGGGNWNRVGFGISSRVTAICIDPTSTSTIYAATLGSGVFKSINAGGSWAASNNGLTDQNVQSLVVDPNTPATLYAGADNGLFKSSDGGNTWAAANVGLTNTNVLSITLNPVVPAILYAGTNGGVFRSVNRGATWAPSSAGIAPPSSIHALAVDPTNPSIVYAGNISPALVYKSIDGGQTWNNMGAGLPSINTFISALAVDPSAPETVYAGTDSSGAFTTTTGGRTWFPTGAPALACTYTLSPATQTFGPQGGIGSFTVTTDPACTWSPSRSSNWITFLASGNKGTGNVLYGVAANGGPERAGTISVEGQAYNIDQQTIACAYTIGLQIADPDDIGGPIAVSVGTLAGCPWTALSNASWITVQSGSPGSGGGVVVLNVALNGGGPRSGTVLIAGQIFTVNQSGGACGAIDVTSKTVVTTGGLSYIPFTTFDYGQKITVANDSAVTISGPVYLVTIGEPTHRGFPKDTGLLGQQLTTTCFSAGGDYLIPIAGSLTPGLRVTIPAVWFTGGGFGISYTTKVLSGTPVK